MEPKAISNYHEATLEKQGYHFVAPHKHSAVKTCLWLRRSIRAEGNCYKGKFYGISAHRCVQMTPCIFCNQRCIHCWRPIEAFNMGEEAVAWDTPLEIVEGCIKEQRRLISGFKGSSKTSKTAFAEAEEPKHAAISLIGEPTLYPHLQELIQEFHSHGMTTFVVTNGTNPAVLREIHPSQLYISLNAPDEAIYKRVEHADFWAQILESMVLMKGMKERTVIRITDMAGTNMVDPGGYAKLLETANPDFVEVKAYMHIGYSRKRLTRAVMPSHTEVKKFAGEIAEHLTASGGNYKIVDESEISRVVLISNLSSEVKALPKL